MQISELKYEVFAVDDDRRNRRVVGHSSAILWFIASMLVAVPLPAFAEADPSENIAIALSSKIAGSQPGNSRASGVIPGSIVDFSNDGGKSFDYVPVAEADGFDEKVTDIKLRPHGVLLATVDKYERFSLGYRMKVK